MNVRVETINVPAGSTIGYGTGVDEDTGAAVTFSGDWRPMYDLAVALAEGQEPVAEVPSWAVL